MYAGNKVGRVYMGIKSKTKKKGLNHKMFCSVIGHCRHRLEQRREEFFYRVRNKYYLVVERKKIKSNVLNNNFASFVYNYLFLKDQDLDSVAGREIRCCCRLTVRFYYSLTYITGYRSTTFFSGISTTTPRVIIVDFLPSRTIEAREEKCIVIFHGYFMPVWTTCCGFVCCFASHRCSPPSLMIASVICATRCLSGPCSFLIIMGVFPARNSCPSSYFSSFWLP